MPWEVAKSGGKFNVVKKGTREKVATHATREQALAQVRAMYANYHGKKRKANGGQSAGLSNAAQRRMATKKKTIRQQRHPHQYYGEGE